MLALNQLVGFGAGLLRSEALIDRTTGIVIGDMTTTAPIENVFDGNTSQAVSGGSGPCPVHGSVTNGFVGKTHVAGKILSRVRAYGGSDSGFAFATNDSVTITLYVKNGTPSSGTDGTAIGSLTFTDTSDATMREIISTDQVNSYTSYWIYIQCGGSAVSTCCAELEAWELN